MSLVSIIQALMPAWSSSHSLWTPYARQKGIASISDTVQASLLQCNCSALDMNRLALLLPAVTALQPLNGIGVKPLGGAASIDVGNILDKKAAVVFGTYAADFNAIEYGQRLRHYAPKLKERGVESLHLILNADEAASEKFVELLGLEGVCEVYCDPTGAAGRAFGCGRGWLPDEDSLFDGQIPINAYGKLFGMLLGLGAWATLPAVIGGYIGNPWRAQPWIEDAMAQGSAQGRWPGTGLVVETCVEIKILRRVRAESSRRLHAINATPAR